MNAYQSQSLRRKIREWYRRHAPRFPWRETADPYHIFISEVMLQQTQIPRVLIKYPEFIKTFPTIQFLARAPLSRILSAWHGMGYNRRGLYLQQSAHIILREHKGNIPKDISVLDALPGIGPYSARAIACFAYDICEPFIETNIRRVIIHEFFPKKEHVHDEKILQVLQHIQPSRCQREWYWALMDYGREALKGVPNANRKSKHYAKQSRFEGSPRYIRAKIISYLLENKKATAEQLHASLKKDKHLTKLVESDVRRVLTRLQKEHLVMLSGVTFRIA
ncbi:MAG: A/G-specific adenine glycosylase [Parcubacteria group bacterium Gr01-1014_29]|nr:MAG: A/G-specific adenine glycosylase [Parcubacteria group bacterium Gr01-1014_29]